MNNQQMQERMSAQIDAILNAATGLPADTAGRLWVASGKAKTWDENYDIQNSLESDINPGM